MSATPDAKKPKLDFVEVMKQYQPAINRALESVVPRVFTQELMEVTTEC